MRGSKYLKDSIKDMQKLMIRLPLRKFEAKSLRQSLRMSRVKEYKHGEVITKEDDADSYVYFLLSGKVRAEKDGTDIGVIGRLGEIFGETKITDASIRSASIYAEGETVCLTVNTPPVVIRSDSDDGTSVLLLLYRIFMELIAIRLRLVTEELIKTKKEIERLRDKNNCE